VNNLGTEKKKNKNKNITRIREVPMEKDQANLKKPAIDWAKAL
jgi:hypothetical protein